MATIPSPRLPLVNEDGTVHPVWHKFLQSLWTNQTPQAALSLTPTASPYTYSASSAGTFWVSGGTVSSVTITRGTTVISTGQTSGGFHLAQNDKITVTYSVAPSLSYLPA